MFNKVNTPTNPTTVWSPTSRLQKKMLTMESSFSKQPSSEYGEKSLDMSDCIDLALKNDFTVRQAWQTAKQAEAEAWQSRHQLYPDVNVTMGFNASKEIMHTHTPPDEDSTGDKEKGVDQHINFGPGLEATYLILDAGGRSASIKATLANLYQQNLNFNQTIQELLLNVERAYFNYCALIETTSTYEENVLETKNTLSIIEQRCDAGLAAKLDVHQARARLEDEQYNLAQSQGDMQEARAQLMQVMGLPAYYAEIKVTLPPEKIKLDIGKDNVVTLIDESLAQRQDIAALKASVRQKEYAVKVTDSKLWPTINAEVVSNYNKFDLYKDPVSPIITRFHSDFNSSFLLQINWDIFDGYNNYYGMIAAKKDLEAEREKLKQAEINAIAGVWGKYYIYEAATKSLAHNIRNLAENEKVYAMTLKGYRAGALNVFDLVYTQRDLFASKLMYIDNRNKCYTSLAELVYEIGAFSINPEINRKIHGVK